MFKWAGFQKSPIWLSLMSSTSSAAISAVVSQDFTALNSGSAVPSWLDVSGITGNRMLYDSTGKLTYAPNNLLVRSNTFSNASWTKDNSSVAQNATDYLGNPNAAWTLTDNAVNGLHRVYLTDSNQAATAYMTVIAKAGTASFLGMQIASGSVTVFDLTNGIVTATNQLNGSITSLGGGWYKCYVRAAAPWQYSIIYMGTTEAQAAIGSYVGSGSTILISYATKAYVTYETSDRSADQVTTTTAAYYGPRFDTDPNTLAAKGLLIEESRVNAAKGLASYTAQGGTWASTSATTAPDGANSAYILTEDTSVNQHRVYAAPGTVPTLTAAQSFSVYFKKGTRNYAYISATDGVSVYASAVFDLNLGAVGETKAATYTIQSSSIQNVGNGWYRCTLNYTPVTTAVAYFTFGAAAAATGNTWGASGFPTYTGTSSTIYVYGPQHEAGAFPTSYIPTTTASVTRAADIIKLSGTALTTLQGAAGTLLQEINLEGNISANQYGIFSGTASPFYLTSALAVSATNGTNVLSAGQTAVVGTTGRVGLAWDAAGRAISWSASAAVTDANLIGTIGATTYLGSNNGSNTQNGWVRALSFYNSKLSNATLATKTAVGGAL